MALAKQADELQLINYQGFSYFVTVFGTLIMTISPTIYTWRATESRTNAENMQRICSSVTAEDNAL